MVVVVEKNLYNKIRYMNYSSRTSGRFNLQGTWFIKLKEYLLQLWDMNTKRVGSA